MNKPSPETRTVKRVLVLNDLGSRGGRDIQRGIFEFLDETGDIWNLRIVSNADAAEVATAADRVRDHEFDGILFTEELAPGIMDLFSSDDTPLVVIGLRHRKLETRRKSIVFVRNDNRGIGRMAAEHFLTMGRYNSYVYVPAPDPHDRYWSDERLDGFTQILGKAGIEIMVPPKHQDLVNWLSSLPKPVAAFAAFDVVAADVIRQCTDAGLKIPDAVSIMGVDNDVPLCERHRPSLTSVLTGHHGMGVAGARELQRLMRKRGVSSARRYTAIPPQEIVIRDSTRLLPPATVLVRRINEFIRRNACTGITVSDVVRHVRVSRRLAELRFRQLEGITLRAAIENERLRTASRLLSSGKHTVISAARRCGFTSANRLTRAFRQRFGLSIREWLHRQT